MAFLVVCTKTVLLYVSISSCSLYYLLIVSNIERRIFLVRFFAVRLVPRFAPFFIIIDALGAAISDFGRSAISNSCDSYRCHGGNRSELDKCRRWRTSISRQHCDSSYHCPGESQPKGDEYRRYPTSIFQSRRWVSQADDGLT